MVTKEAFNAAILVSVEHENNKVHLFVYES